MMRTHPYRALEEAELDENLTRLPEDWNEYVRRAGGRNVLIDHWLAFGLESALRTITITRYRYRSERTRRAIRAARVALRELTRAMWEEAHR